MGLDSSPSNTGCKRTDPSPMGYNVAPPPSDISDAAAAAAVGTTPVEMPGFDKCNSLRTHKISDDILDQLESQISHIKN